MPFAFIFVGIVFLASGILGTTSQLTTLLKGDLTGQHSYIYWALSIMVIGSLGYIDDLKPLSRSFLVLILIVLILSNGGFFQLFDQSIATITKSGNS